MAYVRGTPVRSGSGRKVRPQLGILPVIAAAVPSVSQILGKITTSLLAVIDPGKKRDANREARAEMWYQYASAGSITAARRLHGGTHFQYTAKERQYYIDRWAKFQAANPALAGQAQQLGDLGIPEPGSDLAPPTLSPEDQQAIQAEIDAYHQAHAAAGTTPPPQPGLNIASLGLGGSSPLVLGAALAYALWTGMFKKRGR